MSKLKRKPSLEKQVEKIGIGVLHLQQTVDEMNISLNRRIDNCATKQDVALLSERVGGVESRLDGVEGRLEKVETKVDHVSLRLDHLDKAVTQVVFKEHAPMLENHEKRIFRLESPPQ